MRPSELLHTNGFRLGLLYTALFGIASLLLFGLVYWRICDYSSGQVDSWLVREVDGRVALPLTDLERALNVRAAADLDRTRPMTLFSAGGTWLAGDRALLPSPRPALDQPFRFAMRRHDEAVPFRGILHRLPAGEMLLVARDTSDIDDLRRTLASALLLGGAVVLLLGLTSAVITGGAALGRVERVRSAIESIVNGNFGARLPRDGGGGAVDLLIQVVNRMLDDIERLMHEVKGVTDEIAHDLRTPLTRLLAGLERARRRARSLEECDAAIEEAIVETRGILATFGALLRIAEVESGARRVGFTSIELNCVAADVADFYEPLAERKDIALVLEGSPAAIELSGDPSLLFEAIGNLVDNAIKFTPPGGRVTLRVFGADGSLGFEVGDSGPGIPESERNLVLRRFHRAERSRHTPGAGLGLSLVAAVAKLHGLSLAIEDGNPGCRMRLWRNAPGHVAVERSGDAGREPPAAAGLTPALR